MIKEGADTAGRAAINVRNEYEDMWTPHLGLAVEGERADSCPGLPCGLYDIRGDNDALCRHWVRARGGRALWHCATWPGRDDGFSTGTSFWVRAGPH